MKYLALLLLSIGILSFMPVYWSWLGHVDSYTILFHRGFWVGVTLLPFFIFQRNGRELVKNIKEHGFVLLLSATAITFNWLFYIVAVNNGAIFEASLAYFIAPLLSVFLSYALLKEPMSGTQAFAIACAALSIVGLIVAKGVLPLYAFGIALSFTIYGILSKFLPLPTFVRLFLEGVFMIIAYCIFLRSPIAVYHEFIAFDARTQALLVCSGAITIVPISFFIIAAKNLRFSVVGVLMFLLPSGIFLVGILYFKERVDMAKSITLSLVLLSTCIYSADLLRTKKIASSIG